MIFYYSPLEQFTVTSLSQKTLNIIQDSVPVTNLGVYVIITIILVIGLHFYANNNSSLVASKWSIAIESIYQTVAGIVRDQIGARHEIYTPLIVSMFWFILIANLNGNIAYGYTLTTSAIAAIGLSVTVFLAVTILSITRHKFAFFSFFVPSGTPLALVPALVIIELISYLARAVSLGVRLFANIVAGHTLIKILATFLFKLATTSVIVAIVTIVPFAIFVGVIGLEIAVSFIQSYVFCVLTCSYLKDAIELH